MPFFNSNNIDRNFFSAYTTISSASTFHGIVKTFKNPTTSTRWEFPNNSVSSTGETFYNVPGSGKRLIKAVVNRKQNIQTYDIEGMNITGEVNLFGTNDILNKQTQSTYIDFRDNGALTAITLPNTSNRLVRWFGAGQCDLGGQLDLTKFHLSGFPGEQIGIYLSNNPRVNSVLLKDEVYNLYTNNIYINGCSIGTPATAPTAGTINFNTTVDLRNFKYLNGDINLTGGGFPHGNSAITYVYFPSALSGGNISSLVLNGLPNYTGNSYNLDVSWASGHMGTYMIFNNLPKITGFTYSNPEPNSVYQFDMNTCDLQGNLDFTNFYGMGGNVNLSNNTGLTSITFSTHQMNGMSQLNLINTGLYNLDLSHFYDIGDYSFQVAGCPNLTGITLPYTLDGGSGVYVCNIGNCGYIDLDFSYTHLAHPYGTRLTSQNCPHLTGFTFPYEGVNTNGGNCYNFIYFEGCNIKKFGIENLSGFNHNILDVHLHDNLMSSAVVNEILTKFDNLGWTGNSLSIGGNNAAPDHTSGGFDGIAAKISLIGKSWSVSTS